MRSKPSPESTLRPVCAGLLLFLAPVAMAHDMWIAPPESPPAAGDVVEVRLRVGHGGSEESVTRDSRRIVRFTASGPAIELPVAGLDGARVGGVFRPKKPGLWALAYESTAAYSELTGPRFTAYLQTEGLDAALRLRRDQKQQDEPGRELYSRSLKSLVAIGETRPLEGYGRIGLPLELVAEKLPQAPPTAGATVPLRLYRRGEPLQDALVKVRRLDQAHHSISDRTDTDGRVSFQLGPGSWLATTVYTEPVASSKADWRTIFSSLTFIIVGQASSSLD